MSALSKMVNPLQGNVCKLPLFPYFLAFLQEYPEPTGALPSELRAKISCVSVVILSCEGVGALGPSWEIGLFASLLSGPRVSSIDVSFCCYFPGSSCAARDDPSLSTMLVSPPTFVIFQLFNFAFYLLETRNSITMLVRTVQGDSGLHRCPFCISGGCLCVLNLDHLRQDL